ncbi:MAG: hypothetical protein HC837_09380 [Chloroflexaceae bacterium]|nr:hypothetical protein [Chloroflexaceae bacterium]
MTSPDPDALEDQNPFADASSAANQPVSPDPAAGVDQNPFADPALIAGSTFTATSRPVGAMPQPDGSAQNPLPIRAPLGVYPMEVRRTPLPIRAPLGVYPMLMIMIQIVVPVAFHRVVIPWC